PKWSSFISVDPLAEKYPSISGYAYCANNPVIYVDIDGREIFIPNIAGNPQGAENSKNRNVILGQLQSLSNNKLELIKTKGGYIVHDTGVAYKQNSNKSLHEGTALIAGLEKSDKRVTLKIAKENITQKSENGTSTIFFNPEYEGEGIANQDGTTGRPSKIGLAHELIHADENISNNGKTDNTAVKIKNPDSPGKGLILNDSKAFDRDEMNVRIRENCIREEQKVPLRVIPKEMP
ncbi:M91 family zinc metallopeptidase, partial [Flavobacterium aurantiibacter]